MTRTFTAIFEEHGDWWIGWVEELPGANAQERTLEDNTVQLSRIIHNVQHASPYLYDSAMRHSFIRVVFVDGLFSLN